MNTQSNNTLEIDIHGMNKADAKRHIERTLSNAKDIAEVTIIHGRSSPILKDMVRKELKHYKIARKLLSMNDGVTILLLQ